ncbi:hypothetical protein [Actinoplanes siamensis]|uniref:Uncharacterized protein n=1 Tax=Actinoplanes siamensis TaxID=1223317 RepID=A0A919TIH0_9ACTN|nr:hypothetical protein [Actinoplanes siamensis]GIF03923.1 hypothetical protein Asi03nite_14610 [Actinoplanes siamensis]
MDTVAGAAGNLLTSVVLVLLGPTVFMLLVRRFVPYLGEHLWRAYCDVLIWLLRAPFRVVRVLIREVRGARRH